MPLRNQATENATPQTASKSGRQRCGVLFQSKPLQLSFLKAVFLNCALALVFCGISQAGTDLALSSPGIGGGGNAYTSSFGTVNALAVNGATVPGVTAVAESNGALYYMPITATLTSPGPGPAHHVYLQAYVSTNFANPAALVMYACPSTGSCNSSAGYSALGIGAASATQLVLSPGITGTATENIGVAVWVPDNNGASAFTGTDSANAQITFQVIQRRDSNGSLTTIETDTLTFGGANRVVVHDAVSLNLAADPSGLTISPGSDYSMSFGNVNGLGINPGVGIAGTVAAPGGIIYYTPYFYQVAFSDFNPGTAATVKVYLSMNFSHNPAVLKLEDAASGAGPYTQINVGSGSAIQITNSATDRSSTKRYLGLFVSNANGVGTVPFSDNATLTYQLTVP